MTKESAIARITAMAKVLDGRQMGEEITKEECEMAKRSGLLVVVGYSDDIVEFRGAIDGDSPAYDSGVIPFTNDSLLPDHNYDCGHEFCRYREAFKKAHILAFEFNRNGWKLSTKLPHAKFTVKEGEVIFGDGLVIELPKGGPA